MAHTRGIVYIDTCEAYTFLPATSVGYYIASQPAARKVQYISVNVGINLAWKIQSAREARDKGTSRGIRDEQASFRESLYSEDICNFPE